MTGPSTYRPAADPVGAAERHAALWAPGAGCDRWRHLDAATCLQRRPGATMVRHRQGAAYCAGRPALVRCEHDRPGHRPAPRAHGRPASRPNARPLERAARARLSAALRRAADLQYGHADTAARAVLATVGADALRVGAGAVRAVPHGAVSRRVAVRRGARRSPGPPSAARLVER